MTSKELHKNGFPDIEKETSNKAYNKKIDTWLKNVFQKNALLMKPFALLQEAHNFGGRWLNKFENLLVQSPVWSCKEDMMNNIKKATPGKEPIAELLYDDAVEKHKLRYTNDGWIAEGKETNFQKVVVFKTNNGNMIPIAQNKIHADCERLMRRLDKKTRDAVTSLLHEKDSKILATIQDDVYTGYDTAIILKKIYRFVAAKYKDQFGNQKLSMINELDKSITDKKPQSILGIFKPELKKHIEILKERHPGITNLEIYEKAIEEILPDLYIYRKAEKKLQIAEGNFNADYASGTSGQYSQEKLYSITERAAIGLNNELNEVLQYPKKDHADGEFGGRKIITEDIDGNLTKAYIVTRNDVTDRSQVIKGALLEGDNVIVDNGFVTSNAVGLTVNLTNNLHTDYKDNMVGIIYDIRIKMFNSSREEYDALFNGDGPTGVYKKKYYAMMCALEKDIATCVLEKIYLEKYLVQKDETTWIAFDQATDCVAQGFEKYKKVYIDATSINQHAMTTNPKDGCIVFKGKEKPFAEYSQENILQKIQNEFINKFEIVEPSKDQIDELENKKITRESIRVFDTEEF